MLMAAPIENLTPLSVHDRCADLRKPSTRNRKIEKKTTSISTSNDADAKA